MINRGRHCLFVVALAASLLAGGALAAAAGTGGDASALPPASLHEQVLSLPGDPARPVTLQVTLFVPDGPGPFPLAVVNHGAAENGQPRAMERHRRTFAAFYFLSRGYAVVLPMMRGFAGSGGAVVPHGCDVIGFGMDDARDIAAVIDGLAGQSRIDRSRIVVAGQSFGGWNTLAFGALGHAGLRGLVNFAGGMRESDCAHQDASLIAASAYFGAHAKVPSIWFYGDNDRTFPPATWRAMHARYTRAGGQAELVAYGPFMDDAHQMLSHGEGLPIWTPRVDAFLARIGMPSRPLYPAYMPTPFPPPSHYAAIDDVAAVPYLPGGQRNAYRDFLRRPFTRAFVVSPAGVVAAANGGFDPIARALALCGQHAPGCQVYAVDDDVVWTRPTTPPARSFRMVVDAGTTKLVDFAYSVNPDCSLRGLPTLRVVQPPAHGTARVTQRTGFPRFPPANPFVTCNAVKVPGMALEYAPARGFVGSDSLAFEMTTPEHRERVFRIAITVQ